MLGLGSSRLKVRPSLFELITQNRDRRFSLYSDSPWSSLDEGIDEVLPAASPPTRSYGASSTLQASTYASVIMAPSNRGKKLNEAGDDQQGSIFSISGPVIVAENMIGVAMYELVSSQIPTLLHRPQH